MVKIALNGGVVIRATDRTAQPFLLSFAGNLRVFLALEPCDMRKSSNGLYDAGSPVFRKTRRAGLS